MIMDYCEQEIVDEKLQIHIGLQFEDEPDSLYVALLEADGAGLISRWQLFFNGFDCNYQFKSFEKEEIIRYASEQGAKLRME